MAFVKMTHPDIDADPVDVPEAVVEHWESKGFKIVDATEGAAPKAGASSDSTNTSDSTSSKKTARGGATAK